MLKSAWACAAALLFAVAAAPAQAQPPVWIVRDADSEIVLFGSVHVLPPGLDWEPAAVKAAIAKADDVWFEIPIDAASEQRAAQLASAKGVLPPDKSLYAMLSPAGQARLNKACLRFHLAPGLMDRLEPWYAEVALSGAEFQEAGASASDGVEDSLAAQAPPSAQRRAFETVDQQIEMFDAAPLDAQIASLEETLAELDRSAGSYKELVRAWMAADTRGLERDAIAPLRKAAPEIYRRLVLDRNAAWTRTLDERMKGSGRTVVVVGVGHLVGADGVPARLRALGYSVEGP